MRRGDYPHGDSSRYHDEGTSNEIRDYLLDFPIYNPQGIATYVHAANIFKTCARKGKAVRKTIDCLIAAIAIEDSLVLLHRDRDFTSIAKCTDLKVLEV